MLGGEIHGEREFLCDSEETGNDARRSWRSEGSPARFEWLILCEHFLLITLARGFESRRCLHLSS